MLNPWRGRASFSRMFADGVSPGVVHGLQARHNAGGFPQRGWSSPLSLFPPLFSSNKLA